MKMIITGRKIEVTEGLKEAVTKKLGKLSKFFDDETECNVTLSTQKGDRQIVEVTIYSKGMIYRAEETAPDMYAAIDIIVDVIERQIRKNKTRLAKKLRDTAFAPSAEEAAEEEEGEFKIMKTKRYGVKPMSAEEAILQMNLLGHAFFVFSNAETDATNIVYRRKDGNYGLIEVD